MGNALKQLCNVTRASLLIFAGLTLGLFGTLIIGMISYEWITGKEFDGQASVAYLSLGAGLFGGIVGCIADSWAFPRS